VIRSSILGMYFICILVGMHSLECILLKIVCLVNIEIIYKK
jgi:hypothetical protein